MHPNPAFRGTPPDRNLAFAREMGFGTLAVGTEQAPLMSHIPFILNDEGTLAEFHLVRSNPIVRLLSDPRAARLAIEGPHGYVSPDWYGIEDQVPTWNYVAIHLTGVVERRPADELRDLLDRQSAVFEDRLAPKPPWMTAKMTHEVLERMMRQIVPCAMRVDGVDGTWKLSQNKSDAARESAAGHMDAQGFGREPRVLSALMRGA